jgi:hypothetical protein
MKLGPLLLVCACRCLEPRTADSYRFAPGFARTMHDADFRVALGPRQSRA